MKKGFLLFVLFLGTFYFANAQLVENFENATVGSTSFTMNGFVFTVSLLVAFLILYLVSKFIIWAVRKFFPRNWNFVFRQGLSNLYRPNNQSTILLVFTILVGSGI